MKQDLFSRRLARLQLRLTDEQMTAATHDGGPLLVHAGPGSGKTAVITCRTAFLHWEIGVRPEQIAVFTFTRKSAAELRERLARLDPALAGVNAGTFHSLFLRWLLRAGKENPRLANASERKDLLEQALRRCRRPTRREVVEEFEQHLALASSSTQELPATQWLPARRMYQQLKQEQGLWDFDDILTVFGRHLAADGNFAAYLRDAAAYVMVDEFQDTNPVEWECLQALAGQRGNIAVVGDDDQCIYRFRGAQPELLKLFRARWPQAREVVLHRNFRSADPVVALSQRLIVHNRERTAKTMISAVGAGPRAAWLVARDSFAEARHVARETAGLMRNKSRTVGVLARTHQQLALVAEALRGAGVAYATTGKTAFLYDQPYAAPLVRCLRAACRSVECGRAYADYVRWSGERELVDRTEWEADSRAELAILITRKTNRRPTWERFARLLDDVAGLPPERALDRLLALYLPYLRRLEKISGVNLEAAFCGLDLLRDRAAAADTLEQWLGEIDLLYAGKSAAAASADNIQLLTFHGAKGLEFDRVYVIGLQEGLTPHVKALADGANERERRAALEEERRLFYVALTRARTELRLSCARRTGHRDTAPSRFMVELGLAQKPGGRQSDREGAKASSASTGAKLGQRAGAAEVGDLSAVTGEQVQHRLFGTGIISSVEDMSPKGHKVGIIFNGRDVRYFYWEMAVQAGHIVSRPTAAEGSTQ